MNRSNIGLFASFLVLLSLGAAPVSCTEKPKQSDRVNGPGGGVQPEGNGERISEAEACERIESARKSAAESLSKCAAPKFACPDGIRPLGACDNYEYDAGTVDACVEWISDYEACSDFVHKPCFVTAYPIDGACSSGEGGFGGEGSGSGGQNGSGGGAQGGMGGNL